MKFIQRLLVLIVCLLSQLPLHAQLSRLDAFLKDLETEGTFYGSVLVIRDGKPVFRGNYGYRDEAQTLKNDSTSVYYFAESCEPVCATLMVMAHERGLLSLDAPIGTYLSEFKGRPGPKVRDLLCHASGLPVVPINADGSAAPGSLTAPDLAAELAQKPMLFPPGTQIDWEYRDYDLAGYILETVTGRPYPAILSDWLLQPLKLSHTGVGIHPSPDHLSWAIFLERYQREKLLPWKGNYRASTGMYSTVDDLGIFFEACASGRLISPRSSREMETPIVKTKTGHAGLGCYIEPSGMVFSYGWGGGYTSFFAYDPRYGLRTLVLGNRWMTLTGKSLREVMLPEVYAALELKE